MSDRARILPPIIADVRTRLDIVRDWMRGQGTFEWVEPAGGVVGLVRFAARVDVDTAQFYEVLLASYGTYVGPGHWFEVDDRHFRLGFGWPTEPELRAGLDGLSAAAAGEVLETLSEPCEAAGYRLVGAVEPGGDLEKQARSWRDVVRIGERGRGDGGASGARRRPGRRVRRGS